METSLKPGFAQIFSCCPKNLSCLKFGGAAAPPAPPARTPMICTLIFDKNIKKTKHSICRNRLAVFSFKGSCSEAK